MMSIAQKNPENNSQTLYPEYIGFLIGLITPNIVTCQHANTPIHALGRKLSEVLVCDKENTKKLYTVTECRQLSIKLIYFNLQRK